MQLVPDHVLSVKCLSDHLRNATMNTPTVTKIPEEIEDLYNNPQQIDQGEKSYIPDPLKLKNDLLLEDIAKLKIKVDESGATDSIIKAIKRIEEELSNKATRRGILSKKRGIKIRGVNTGNIKDGKRVRIGRKNLAVQYKGKTYDQEPETSGEIPHAADISVLDKVQILTTHFGEEYAVGKPKYTKGIVKRVKGKIAYVLWEDQPDTGKPWKMQASRLKKYGTALAVLCDLSMNSAGMTWPYKKLSTILPILEVGSCLTDSDPNSGGNWPKDFYEALIRPDWRLWVEAVKSENESWEVFDACTEIPYENMLAGASVIPLGELFTIKRSGKYKFRQIALGNLLRQGKDYGETFASTVSGDGLRWFC